MEESNKPPTAEELLRKIQELEKCHTHIKLKISKLTLSLNRPKLEHQTACSQHLAIGGYHGPVKEPFAMKLAETQYLNIAQSMGQAIHVFDRKYRIYFWNRTAESLYGFSPAEAYEKTPTELLVQPKDAVTADYLLERTVNGESWSGEFPVTNNRGESFVVICTNTPLRDGNRRLIGGMCVSSDARPYQVMKPTRIYPQQPLQTSVSSKISNLASKVKLKMKLDHKPWKGNVNELVPNVTRFGRFGWYSTNINQEHEPSPQMSSSILDCQLSLNTSNKIEVSGLWLSTVTDNSTSSSRSTSSTKSSNAIIKVEKETDIMDYEILWEDLVTKEQIGQGITRVLVVLYIMDVDVAVKIFTYQEYSDDVMVSFKQEVSLMKRLRHPNILLFMGAVTSPQYLSIVTEFLPRGSLFRILQRNSTRLDWRRRVHMAMDIARGMNYLHHYNPLIVHRDLKSSNLLVDKNWTVKPQWMAPEVIRNEEADEKSDVYSYGVVLWEIITERIPWGDLNPMQVIAAVGFMNQRLEIPKDVDPLWVSLIESCWCSEPSSRPTFQEILYKLKYLQKMYAVDHKRL